MNRKPNVYSQQHVHKMLYPNGHKLNSKITWKISTVDEHFILLSKADLFLVLVPTLVQFLKDIDKAGDIMDYVQPYIGSVSKAKEFANDFLIKRNQLIKAEVINSIFAKQSKLIAFFFFFFFF